MRTAAFDTLRIGPARYARAGWTYLAALTRATSAGTWLDCPSQADTPEPVQNCTTTGDGVCGRQ
jgi:hypothetical protein